MQETQETWVGEPPGEGNGNPFQYPCLEDLMDRAAWEATVHAVAKGCTQLIMSTSCIQLIGGGQLVKLGQVESSPGKLGTWNKVILLWALEVYRCAIQSYWQSCFVPWGPGKQRIWWKRNRGDRRVSWQSEFLSHAISEFSFLRFLCVALMRPVSIFVMNSSFGLS